MVEGVPKFLGGAGGADKNSGILFVRFNGLRCSIASASLGGVSILVCMHTPTHE